MVEFKKELIFSRSYTTGSDIASGATSTERFISQDDVDQYAPFDTLIIVNGDTNALGLNLDLNPDNQIPISAGGAVATDTQKFSNFSITNNGAANHTAGKIHVLVQKYKWVPIQ